jgi:hypothetical protein
MSKDFFEIDGPKQCEIMVALLKRFADSGVPMLEALSEKEGRTPQAVWDDLCTSSGIEPCKVPDFLLMRPHAPAVD